jgi:hypothetical protein
MIKHLSRLVFALAFLVCGRVHSAGPETNANHSMPPPQTDMKSHTIGEVRLVVTNSGCFGNAAEYDVYDWSCEFPASSGQDYLFLGALWIGGIVNGETLVSVGNDGWLLESELFPGSSPSDTIVERSTDTLSPYYTPDAVSEQDFVSEYTDTVGPPYSPPSHTPLGIRVTQGTYCWTRDYARDFVAMHFLIENLRGDHQTIDGVYIGLYVDGDVTPVTSDPICRSYAAQDDITGFRTWQDPSDTLWPPGQMLRQWDGTKYVRVDVGNKPMYESPCEFISTAWLADDDGLHPALYCADAGTSYSVVGTNIVCPPYEAMSFNWWFSDQDDALDWGPYHPEDPADFGGTPMGDPAKYRIMSNGYIDPDQVCDPLAYPAGIDSINDTRYLLSFGPYDLPYGDTLEIALAHVGGELFHENNQWCEWSFGDLATNVSWAQAVCDNPGVDTDGDGYAGDFLLFLSETLFICGDGVPDFKVFDRLIRDPCRVPVGAAELFTESEPCGFQLTQNVPNPLSSKTKIGFSTPRQGRLTLGIYDVCGRLVLNLVDREVVAGRHECSWNGIDSSGKSVGSGTYFLLFQAGDFTDMKKMILLR